MSAHKIHNTPVGKIQPWNFCETPKEKCTMNYCDENGCQNRKRNYVEGNDLIAEDK